MTGHLYFGFLHNSNIEALITFGFFAYNRYFMLNIFFGTFRVSTMGFNINRIVISTLIMFLPLLCSGDKTQFQCLNLDNDHHDNVTIPLDSNSNFDSGLKEKLIEHN